MPPGERPRRRALMGLMFFPRGGSAQVVRELARQLPRHGWDVTIACGSLSTDDGHGDARRFFEDAEVHPMDYTRAIEAEDPLRADPPMHPSYEEREDAADRVFASVDDETFEHLTGAWARHLEAAGAARADVLHLHHLTPLYEAARRVAPGVPVVGHLHGTELLMVERIEEGAPPGWKHAEAWLERMHRWVEDCEVIVAGSENLIARAERLLGVERSRCVLVTNGCDTERFDRRPGDRAAHWRRHLTERPQGWGPGEAPGTVAYDEADVARLAEGTVLLYVGRFTEVKRLPLLVRAFADARERFERPAGLAILGGYPGEWEGEHPLEAIQACGVEREVFLAGWHGHAALPEFMNVADVVVLPSVREQFGQVLVEGMACGLPAIAVDAGGPSEIVDDGETGWLVPGDDRDALAGALVEAVNDQDERRRRGNAAYEVARERYAWAALSERLVEVYERAGARGG